MVKTAMGGLDNAFVEKRHLSVYEHIKLSSPKYEPIQKILAAPLKSKGDVFGVVEVSRKGTDSAEAGPALTSSDLALLHDILTGVSLFPDSLALKLV